MDGLMRMMQRVEGAEYEEDEEEEEGGDDEGNEEEDLMETEDYNSEGDDDRIN